jgi:hypothetical protein
MTSPRDERLAVLVTMLVHRNDELANAQDGIDQSMQ